MRSQNQSQEFFVSSLPSPLNVQMFTYRKETADKTYADPDQQTQWNQCFEYRSDRQKGHPARNHIKLRLNVLYDGGITNQKNDKRNHRSNQSITTPSTIKGARIKKSDAPIRRIIPISARRTVIPVEIVD